MKQDWVFLAQPSREFYVQRSRCTHTSSKLFKSSGWRCAKTTWFCGTRSISTKGCRELCGKNRSLGRMPLRLNEFQNKQNVWIWSDEPHYEVKEHILHSSSVMVRFTISKDRVIGPYFFENVTVTKASYKYMLSQYAFPNFSSSRSDNILMQEGALPHSSYRAKLYLNNKRQENWIDRGGHVSWPPRSPELTPWYFFLWGHLK